MFQFRYATSELRRRAGRTILTALGLAAGVGLVIGIIGISQGLHESQTKVLAPLSSIGTDVLVTRVAGEAPSDGSTPASTTTTTTAPQQQQGGFAFGGPGGGGGGGGPGGGGGGRGGGFFGTGALGNLNSTDAAALLNENDSVLTDLSKLGKPGDKFTHDFFVPDTLLSFPDAAISEVSKLPGVTSAVGGLTLVGLHQTGTVPNIVATVNTGEQTIQQTVTPAPLTREERQAQRQCLEAKGVTFGGRDRQQGGTQTTPTTTAGGGQQAGPPPGGGGGFDDQAFQDCLPERFKSFINNVVIPARTIQQVVNPPTTDINSANYTAAGVDPNSPKAGLVTAEQVTSGRFLNPGANDEVLLNVAYANKKNLAVGGTLPINGTDYKIVGIVNPTLSGTTADVYFPLSTMQELSNKQGRVNQVLVRVKNSASVDKVAKEISQALPGAQVVTTKALASQVTGSLNDAKKLADRLGGALAVIVLAATFAIAMLLTLSSVAKRVREIGTLRAIGWPKAKVVRQVLTETLGIGVLGGVIGIGIGYLAAAAVSAFSPTLTASNPGVPNAGSSSLAGLFGPAVQNTASAITHNVKVHAPVHFSTLLLGVGFAVLGGLLAGAVGGWRAARMSPAEALRNVG